ncbi:MAG: hypothetical protein AB8I80_23235, partial [Anaerolineae bacterium]
SAGAAAAFGALAYAASDAGQTDREAMALERAESLKPRLAYLTVTVAGPNTEGLEVLRDGEVQRQATFGVPVPIDAGEHRIEARAPDRQPWSKTIVVAQGPGTIEVRVPQLQEPAAKPVAPVPAARPVHAVPKPAPPPVVATHASAEPATQAQADSAPGSSQRTWGWLTVGAGGAALAVGGTFAILAASADAKADEQCRPDDPTLCNEKGVSLGEEATRKAGVATLATGIGAALAIAGGVLVLTAPSDPASSDVALGIRTEMQPAGATFGVEGTW